MLKIFLLNAILFLFVVGNLFISQLKANGLLSALLYVVIVIVVISVSIELVNRNVLKLIDANRKGYEALFKSQEKQQEEIEKMGFTHFDSLTTKSRTKVLIFAYHSQDMKVILCSYHFKLAKTIDLASDFQNGISITTTNSGALGPRPPTDLFQTFANKGLGELLAYHMESIAHVESEGLPLNIQDLTNFRQSVIDGELRQIKARKRIPFYQVLNILYGPIRIIRLSNKTIKEQIESGIIPKELFK